MKTTILALTLIISTIGLGQESEFLNKEFLVNTSFKIDKILGLDSSIVTYSISLAVDTPYYDYGNRLGFIDSLFFSHYTAPCGNDYFTDVQGPYRILEGNILEICVKQISYHGEWDPPKPSEYPNEQWLSFRVAQTENGLVLVKI